MGKDVAGNLFKDYTPIQEDQENIDDSDESSGSETEEVIKGTKFDLRSEDEDESSRIKTFMEKTCGCKLNDGKPCSDNYTKYRRFYT